MTFRIVILIVCLTNISFAQKQDYIWLSGIDQVPETNEVDGMSIDFNMSMPEYLPEIFKYGFGTYNGSICDERGKLLFYTNGCAILNADGSVMTNGDSLNYNEWFENWSGGDCDFGYIGHEDVLILPNLSKNSSYYIIGKVRIINGSSQSRTFELHISEIVLDSINGNRVVTKNEKLYEGDDLSSSYLSAVPIKESEGFFIFQPKVEDSSLVSYKLDENGFERLDDQNLEHFFDNFRSSASGTSKFSPDGSRYAFYNFYDGLHVYDFDRETGKISNHQYVEIFDSVNIDDIRFSSVEWSPNSRFIYTSSRDELHQIDTWEENLQDGIRLIDVYNGTVDPFPTPFFLMSLAPDCRIYIYI